MSELTQIAPESFKGLPRLAVIAFAARTARRVLPPFRHDWPDAPEEHYLAVDSAVVLAEGRGAGIHTTANAAYAAARAAADAAYAAAAAVHAPAYAAASTAYAAASASAADDNADTAFEASRTAAAAAAGVPVNDLMLKDITLLQEAALSGEWNDDTFVSPDFFGPLWPDGKPSGW